MSATMKEQEIGLAVIPKKSLAEILVIHNQLPDDFYKNTAQYHSELDTAIITAQSLVHEITDEGRKSAKADAALIRKYAKTTNTFSLSTFRSLTDKVKLWKDGITGKTKLLENEADNIMARFEEMEGKKLGLIMSILSAELANYRKEIGLRPEFYRTADLSPMVKLTGVVTDGGKLTSKAIGFIKTIANGNLSLQTRHDNRVLLLENRCLRADINPPLTQAHFGEVFYAEDEVFNTKVDELINTEIERRAEMEARIIKKQAAENQRKIDEAVAQGVAMAQRKEMAESKPVTTMQNVDDALAKEAKRKDDIKHPPVVGHLRAVIITATFEFKDINDKTSNEAVVKFFRGKLPEQMLAKLSKVSYANA